MGAWGLEVAEAGSALELGACTVPAERALLRQGPGGGLFPAIFWLGVPKFCIQITRTLLKKSSISAESSRRDTSKSEVFSVLGALACTHDLLKVRPKCHYGVFFAQHFSLAKAITLANLTMHIYEVWPAGTPKY